MEDNSPNSRLLTYEVNDFRPPNSSEVMAGIFAILFGCLIILFAIGAMAWAIVTVFWPDSLLGDKTYERFVAASCMALFSAFLMLPAFAMFRTAARHFKNKHRSV